MEEADLSRRELVRAKTDGDLARIIEVGIPGTEMPAAWHMSRREVTQVAAFVRSLAKVDTGVVTGDSARGNAVYDKSGCAACHTVKSNGIYTGGLMGPDLSSIGRSGARHTSGIHRQSGRFAAGGFYARSRGDHRRQDDRRPPRP